MPTRMESATATVLVGERGRVTIPSHVRDKLDIEEEDYVEITIEVDE